MSVKDANRRLSLVGSEDRAAVLADELQRTPHKPSARKLAREWFNLCDAIGPYATALRTEFFRIGFFTDSDTVPDLPVVVYRAAYEDDDIANALSWTTDRAVAEKFARMFMGPRGWFLGLKRTDTPMLIWRGVCTEAYGYLDDRQEREVIAKTVVEVEAVAKLVSVPKEASDDGDLG